MDVTDFLAEIPQELKDAPQMGADDPRSAAFGLNSPSVGAEIRRLRKERGWKLQDLAERSGVSMSTLSRVETGQMTLSIDRAHSLLNALGLNFSSFLTDVNTLPEPAISGWRSVSRAGEERVVTTRNGIYRYICADVLNRRTITLIAIPTARTVEEHGPLVSHPGEEFLHVLSGEIVLVTTLYDKLTMKPGDSLLFDSRTPHAVLRGGDEEPRVLATMLDPRRG